MVAHLLLGSFTTWWEKFAIAIRRRLRRVASAPFHACLVSARGALALALVSNAARDAGLALVRHGEAQDDGQPGHRGAPGGGFKDLDAAVREQRDKESEKAMAEVERASAVTAAEAAAAAEERERDRMEKLDREAREAAMELQANRRAKGEREAKFAVAALSVGADHGQSGVDQPPERASNSVGAAYRPGPFFQASESSPRINELLQQLRQRGPGQPKPLKSMPASRGVPLAAKFECTACGHHVHVRHLKEHPNLSVAICYQCFSFIFSSPYTKDVTEDGSCATHENQCRWCGDGGSVVLCDTCDKAFCKKCIKRNFGVAGLAVTEEPMTQWSCYVCDHTPLASLTRQFRSIQGALVNAKTASNERRSKRSHSARPMRPYEPFQRRNNTAHADETIAAAIARRQKEMQQLNP